MPLVRFQVRNEYGLGQPELYQEINGEDPKAVLDGVAVAGLVGILRQLGDLAEFAAEVFHGLQEQVMTTASRSHKLNLRVRNIEAALPFLEKAVLAQTSHIHFAYTAGHEWHPRLQNEQNHFIYNDLPRFIMNSYEECRDPPRLHLLDKFDTGGPGSCLRRYSDPTFFRRASGFPIERNGEEFQRDKKSRKSKKKRSSQRNREISRCASFSNRSNRMQFTYPIVNGQTSQSAPADDMTFKSELGDHSNSFDSKSVSGYIDCVFDLHSSMQPDEKESKEFSSGLMQQIDDTSASGFSDERTQVVYDNFPYSPSDEQVAPSSSSVTWDEKAHIVESKDQQCDRDEFPELLETNLGLNAQDMEAANLRGADSVAAPFDNVDSPKSGSSMNQLDEIDSEPDNYVDALNTIESESENDLDHQTKREVEEYSRDVNHDSLEDGIIEPHSPDHDGSAVEPHTVSSIAMKDVISCGLPEPVSSENSSEEQMPQVSGRPLDSVYSQDADVCADGDVLNVSNVESVLTDPLISSPGSRISDSQNPLCDRIISVVDEPQGSHLEVSSVHSVKIWTNGGLLGLEPSKPPDFAVPNSIVQDLRSKSEDEVDGHPNQQKERLGKLVDNSQTIQGVPSSVNEKISVPVVDLDPKLENSGDSQQSKRSNNANGAVLTTNGMVVLGTKQPVNPDAEGMPIGYNQEIDENSSGVFGLGHRLLVNGFRRKVSLAHDGKSEPASTPKSEFMDQGNKHHSISYGTIFDTTFKDGFGHSSALDPLTSSPPLEHMKISFNPIDGFETSKLKLKIPDGSQCYENVGDMFPSFQLVPEPAIPMHDVGSDSDDDTFYRSSPYMSDDCLSHQSESNSEQWESGETLDSKDQELYDALCRMSSVESISSSMEVGETANNCIHVDGGLKSTYTENGVESSLSGSLLDIPSFDAVHPSLQIGTRDNSDSKNLLKVQSPVESTPLPPPLPPVQWRVSKPHSDMLEDKQHTLPDPLEDAVDVKLLGSSQQPKEALANEKQYNEEATASKPQNKANQWKLNGQSETKQAANGKGVDEKEDFLHQIRTKSLNLRRTTTTRPTVAPVPTTSVNVTAILEKANAIRQVVASDDGEDDDWSDT